MANCLKYRNVFEGNPRSCPNCETPMNQHGNQIVFMVLIMLMCFFCYGCGENSEIEKTASGDKKESKSGFETMIFGSYEQDNTVSNGKEPIEWIILSQNDSEILLLSKYALDCKPYNTEQTNVTWESCSLRKWLNEEFYKDAFSEEDKKRIIENSTMNSYTNKYGIGGGNDTKDKVFLLSLSEVTNKEYGFSSSCSETDITRRCAPTDYAMAKGADRVDKKGAVLGLDEYGKTSDGEYTCWWWLRSPGSYARNAVPVFWDGSVFETGNYVDRDTKAIRPAIKIRLNP